MSLSHIQCKFNFNYTYRMPKKKYTFSHRFSTTLHNSYKKLFFPSIFKGFSPKTTIFLGFSKNKIFKVNSDFFRFLP